MAKTERMHGDYIFVDSLDNSQIQEFIDDCEFAGGTDVPHPVDCHGNHIVQFDDDGCVETWHHKDTHWDVDNPRNVTHEYIQGCSQQSQVGSSLFVCDIREISLTGYFRDSRIRQECNAVFTAIFSEGDKWWDISKHVCGKTMIDTEKVVVVELVYQLIHDVIVEYDNDDVSLLREIFEDASNTISNVEFFLVPAYTEALYDWFEGFKEQYYITGDIQEKGSDDSMQSLTSMLMSTRGVFVGIGSSGITVIDDDLETEIDVASLEDAKHIIEAKRRYLRAMDLLGDKGEDQ